MIESSKNNRENFPRKCFLTQEKETRVEFNPGLSANRPSNYWALAVKGVVSRGYCCFRSILCQVIFLVPIRHLHISHNHSCTLFVPKILHNLLKSVNCISCNFIVALHCASILVLLFIYLFRHSYLSYSSLRLQNVSRSKKISASLLQLF